MAEEFQISDFDYPLPAELIAQEPSRVRDQARLLVLQRTLEELHDRLVADLPQWLRPGDLLVLNDTRVLPARLFGRRARTQGKWEGLYLRTLADGVWELLNQTRGRLQPGEIIEVEGGLRLEVVQPPQGRQGWFRPLAPGSAVDLLQQFGRVPIPPYIRQGQDQPMDRERYQTVFARVPGSVAAPTAGLHFTPELLRQLTARGIDQAAVTLHVGLGTFLPLSDEQLQTGRLHQEEAMMPAAACAAVAACKQRGGRVVAVGTTTVRTLETAAQAAGGTDLRPWTGQTELFIRPGFRFQVVDALLTNFHLPRSSLLMLAAAFAGRERILRAYAHAVQQRYRFFSYGDAMLIL